MAVSFERISAGDRGVGGQPARCDGSLGRKEIFQSQEEIQGQMKGVVVGEEPSSSGKLPEGWVEEGWEQAGKAKATELQKGGEMAFGFG